MRRSNTPKHLHPVSERSTCCLQFFKFLLSLSHGFRVLRVFICTLDTELWRQLRRASNHLFWLHKGSNVISCCPLWFLNWQEQLGCSNEEQIHLHASNKAGEPHGPDRGSRLCYPDTVCLSWNLRSQENMFLSSTEALGYKWPPWATQFRKTMRRWGSKADLATMINAVVPGDGAAKG